jgi:sialate O-acetylesterase
MKHSQRSFLLLFFTAAATAPAEVVPNPLFSHNAVLQQGLELPVWGTARDGEKVTVSVAGAEASTTAKDGRWMVRLPKRKHGGPHVLTIRGDNTVTATNVVVGEVWLCSGQSNMEKNMGPRNGQEPVLNWKREAADADLPMIRQFLVPREGADKPRDTLGGSWVVCSPASVTNFTAAGFFMAKDLHEKLRVPVGIIHASYGGTPAESWTRREVLETVPELKGILDTHAENIRTFAERRARFESEKDELKRKHAEAVKKAGAEGRPAPRGPQAPRDPVTDIKRPSALYNAMIHPLIPYAMRGVAWYQGESNSGRAKEYQTLFPAMITDWRKQWGGGDFPFLFVQISGYHGMPPEIREAQLLTLGRVPNTAMAVITDVSTPLDIHPPDKKPVGRRLALAALALAYQRKVEYSGPLFESAVFTGPRAVVSFTHVDGGLESRGGAVRGFQLAGADRVFHPAAVEFQGTKAVLTSPAVPAPVAVRFGWDYVPDTNLVNRDGLPASPFRTDDWDEVKPAPKPLR